MSDTIFFQILESGSLVDLHTKFGGSNSKARKKCHWGGPLSDPDLGKPSVCVAHLIGLKQCNKLCSELHVHVECPLCRVVNLDYADPSITCALNDVKVITGVIVLIMTTHDYS